MKRKIRIRKIQLGATVMLSALILSSCGAANPVLKDALNEANQAVYEANEAVDEAVNDVYKDSLNAFKEEAYETDKEASVGEGQSALSKSIGTVTEYDNNGEYVEGGEQNEIPDSTEETNVDAATFSEKKIRTVRMTL